MTIKIPAKPTTESGDTNILNGEPSRLMDGTTNQSQKIMNIQIATGNHDATGKINGVFYKGQSVEYFQGETLVANSDVYIGGCCVFRDGEWKQASYQDSYGNWAHVVKVPRGSMFSVNIINHGDLRNMAEVTVGKSAPAATV